MTMRELVIRQLLTDVWQNDVDQLRAYYEKMSDEQLVIELVTDTYAAGQRSMEY